MKKPRGAGAPICPSLRTFLYVSNLTLHDNLNIEPAVNLAKIHYKKFHFKLHYHPNPLIANQHTVSIPDNPPHRIKRRLCRDLLV
jgi:hypothetical protein